MTEDQISQFIKNAANDTNFFIEFCEQEIARKTEEVMELEETLTVLKRMRRGLL